MDVQLSAHNERVLNDYFRDFENNRNVFGPTVRRFLEKSLARNETWQKSHGGSYKPLSVSWFEDTALALEKGVNAGLLVPQVLLDFNFKPLVVLEKLTKSLRDRLGVPDPEEVTQAIAKGFRESPTPVPPPSSSRESRPFNFEDAYLALEKAVHEGRLPSDILLQFQFRPIEVLKSLSSDLRKSFGIPQF